MTYYTFELPRLFSLKALIRVCFAISSWQLPVYRVILKFIYILVPWIIIQRAKVMFEGCWSCMKLSIVPFFSPSILFSFLLFCQMFFPTKFEMFTQNNKQILDIILWWLKSYFTQLIHIWPKTHSPTCSYDQFKWGSY